MAGLITQYASGNSQKLVTQVESVSQVLVSRWDTLRTKSALSKEEIEELEKLEGRVQKTAELAIYTLDHESHSSSQISMREALRKKVATHCENAQQITQQARIKMGLPMGVAQPFPQHVQKTSGRGQEGEADIMAILNDWVRAAPVGEQRQTAANRIAEFLT
jgi:hypothetical protein